MNIILGKIAYDPDGVKIGPDQTLLKRQIDEIRKNGYGTSSGETHPDAAGISIPVKGYFFPVVLCVMGPTVRFNPIRILSRLRDAAGRISAALQQDIER